MCFVSSRSRVSRFASHHGVLRCRVWPSLRVWCAFFCEFWTLLPCLLYRSGIKMLTVETAVFDCICWFISSRDTKGQSYPIEYCLESVEECSEGKVHKSEPEPWNGNVNTVYFINQARGNTRISCTEFVYDGQARDCKCFLIFELLLNIFF